MAVNKHLLVNTENYFVKFYEELFYDRLDFWVIWKLP